MPVSDTVLLLSLLLLVRVGHALLISGSVRSKNAAGAIVRLLLDLSVACLALWAIGAAFVSSIVIRALAKPPLPSPTV